MVEQLVGEVMEEFWLVRGEEPRVDLINCFLELGNSFIVFAGHISVGT